MDKFNSKIALALLSTLVNAHGSASAMNSNTNKSISGPLASESDVLRGPAKQENILKKLWPLWGILGVVATSFITFGIIKALKPAQESGEILKKKCAEKGMEGKLDSLINQIESQQSFKDNFDKDLKNNKSGLSETCDICFDSEGNFECYSLNNKNKVELNELEKLVVKEISDLFFKELAIRPARVSRGDHNFYFNFNIDGSIQGRSYFNLHHSAFSDPLRISVTA